MLHTRRLLVPVVAAAAAMMWAPTAATALTCAAHPHASPKAIAEGTEELAGESTFRQRYDGAIFGTVLSMKTQDDGEEPHYGRTEIVVDVTGTFGPEVGTPTVIVEDDPGWLNGYAFEVGTHYFVPYVENEKGRYSHLCDPIAEVDAAHVPGLVELAEQSAWAPRAGIDSSPSEQAVGASDEQPPAQAADESASSGSDTTWVLALLGLLATAVGAGLWTHRKGRESEAVSAP